MPARNKTAPALIEDLLSYGARTCRHVYRTNHERSNLPNLDETPSKSTVWHVVAICCRCRCHLELTIRFHQSSYACPNTHYPLHHFLWEGDSNNDGRLVVRFECTSLMCQAALVIQIQSPLLSATEIAYLTDKAALKTRYELTLQEHSKAIEITPKEALDTFKSYVRDSITNDDPQKKIPEHNKRFMGALGHEAGELLTKLGFRYSPPNATQHIAYWYLPKPVDAVRGTDEPFKTFLQDNKDEIDVLIETIAYQERGSDLGDSINSTFTKDVQRLLGSLDRKCISFGCFFRSQHCQFHA